MKGDISNNIKSYSYPQINISTDIQNDQLVESKIISLIENHSSFIDKFNEDQNFYLGKNKSLKYNLDDAPDNEINIPYSRTLINTVKGYMYKSGLIQYKIEDETNQEYFDLILDVFKENKESDRCSELGEDQSKYGIAFELLYSKLNEDGKTIPYFKRVNPQEIIPVYDYSIEKNLICTIRYYALKGENNKDLFNIEIYYKNKIDYYRLEEVENKKRRLIYIETLPNFFNDIPVCIYLNNEDILADYEPVRTLIEMNDKLISGMINENDKFASAYMIMQNYILGGNTDEGKEKLERLKRLRVFEIDGDGDIKFLTKNIPTEFFREIKQTIKENILYHTQIPDFRDESFGTASGIALRYKLMGFENLCANKEAYFRNGLERRLKLLSNFLKIQNKNFDISSIQIVFSRNIPDNETEKIDNFKKVDPDGGKISKRTALSIMPATIIKDVNNELEMIEEEKKKKQEEDNVKFDLENFEIDEENIKEDEIIKKNNIEDNDGLEETNSSKA